MREDYRFLVLTEVNLVEFAVKEISLQLISLDLDRM